MTPYADMSCKPYLDALAQKLMFLNPLERHAIVHHAKSELRRAFEEVERMEVLVLNQRTVEEALPQDVEAPAPKRNTLAPLDRDMLLGVLGDAGEAGMTVAELAANMMPIDEARKPYREPQLKRMLAHLVKKNIVEKMVPGRWRVASAGQREDVPPKATLKARLIELLEARGGATIEDMLTLVDGDTKRKQVIRVSLSQLKAAGQVENPRKGYWVPRQQQQEPA